MRAKGEGVGLHDLSFDQYRCSLKARAEKYSFSGRFDRLLRGFIGENIEKIRKNRVF